MRNNNNIEYWLSLIACALILSFYFFPYFYLQKESHVTILDNLDSDVVWFKTVAQSGKLFTFGNDVLIENIMNGIPRNSLPPAFNLVSILFYFFNPFTAFIINLVLIHSLAFFGMFILLKDFVFKKEKESVFLFGISVTFAILPFWGLVSGLAISGLPIVAWCFLHFYNGTHKYYHYAILLIFIFYSSLIYTGIFILFILFIIYLYSLFLLKKHNLPFLLGILIMAFGYIIAELNLVIQFISGDFISHRAEWKNVGDSLIQSLENSIDVFLIGNYKAPSLNSPFTPHTSNNPFIILISVFGLLISLKKLRRKDCPQVKYCWLIVIIFFLLIIISFLYGFWDYSGFINFSSHIYLLKVIIWSRFQWMAPFLLYVLFALSLKVMLDNFYPKSIIRSIALVTMGLQIVLLLITNTELRTNYLKIYSKLKNTDNLLGMDFKNYLTGPSFRQFYDEELFKEIKEYIGKPQSEYRVISLGIYPEIAIYNGFYSLDSYQRNYDLSYKHKFRKIICSELEKSARQKDYFDNWGSRCYAFSSELGGMASQLIRKDSAAVVKKLDFDIKSIKELGGKYIISAVNIEPANNTWLVLKKTFDYQESFWKIYLYEII